MHTPNGTVAGGTAACGNGMVVKDEVRPTQAALDAVWDRLGELTVTIDHLSNRLEPAISPAPVGGNCGADAEAPIVSPLTVNIQRIGYSVANAEARLSALINRLDL